MTDQFGASLDRILQELTKRIQKLEASARGGPGLTIGSASGPFLIPDSSTPPAPAAGGYLYYAGSTLMQRTPFAASPVGGHGASVPDPDGIGAPILSSGATVVGSDYNTLRGDVVDMRGDLLDLITSLRDGDVIDT